MRDIDDAIEHVKGTMVIEGVTLTAEDIARGRKILEGTLDPEAVIAEIRAKYAQRSTTSSVKSPRHVRLN